MLRQQRSRADCVEEPDHPIWEEGETFFEEQERQGAQKRLGRQLTRLGYHVDLQPTAQAG